MALLYKEMAFEELILELADCYIAFVGTALIREKLPQSADELNEREQRTIGMLSFDHLDPMLIAKIVERVLEEKKIEGNFFNPLKLVDVRIPQHVMGKLYQGASWIENRNNTWLRNRPRENVFTFSTSMSC